MRETPIESGSIDAVFFGASLHHAPLEEVIPEAARILRQGGLLVATDSPIYPDERSRLQAKARSDAYYASAGFPGLIGHYHPIAVGQLRQALESSGFRVHDLDLGARGLPLLRRLTRRAPASLVVAEKIRHASGYA